MTQKDKELLLKDISARLSYRVKLRHIPSGENTTLEMISCLSIDGNIHDLIENFRPYLRPMSSMTDEESAELSNIISEWFDKELFYLTEEPMIEYALSRINYSINPKLFDWLNRNMFDYCGLIQKGLAIEAPKEMYN